MKAFLVQGENLKNLSLSSIQDYFGFFGEIEKIEFPSFQRKASSYQVDQILLMYKFPIQKWRGLLGERHSLAGVQVKCMKYVEPNQYDGPTNRIFLKNLPKKTTRDDIRSVFSDFGFIEYIFIGANADKDPSCYGYVTFRDPGSVKNAMKFRDTIFIDGQKISVIEFKGNIRKKVQEQSQAKNVSEDDQDEELYVLKTKRTENKESVPKENLMGKSKDCFQDENKGDGQIELDDEMDGEIEKWLHEVVNYGSNKPDENYLMDQSKELIINDQLNRSIIDHSENDSTLYDIFLAEPLGVVHMPDFDFEKVGAGFRVLSKYSSTKIGSEDLSSYAQPLRPSAPPFNYGEDLLWSQGELIVKDEMVNKNENQIGVEDYSKMNELRDREQNKNDHLNLGCENPDQPIKKKISEDLNTFFAKPTTAVYQINHPFYKLTFKTREYRFNFEGSRIFYKSNYFADDFLLEIAQI